MPGFAYFRCVPAAADFSNGPGFLTCPVASVCLGVLIAVPFHEPAPPVFSCHEQSDFFSFVYSPVNKLGADLSLVEYSDAVAVRFVTPESSADISRMAFPCSFN